MRNKEFDKTKVLDKAVFTFWKRGYANTSIQNLVDEMGINRRSMYTTFGDKHQLLMLSLKRYFEVNSNNVNQKIQAESTLRGKIFALFNVYSSNNTSRPKGCFIVNSAIELAQFDTDVLNLINNYFQAEINFIESVLVKFEKDLAENTDFFKLAMILQNALVGIRVVAKSGFSSQQLELITKQTIQSLPWRKNN